MAQRTSEGQEAGGTLLPIEAGGTLLTIEAGGTLLTIEAGGTLLTIEAGGTLLTIEHRSAYIEQNKIRKSLNTLFQKTVT